MVLPTGVKESAILAVVLTATQTYQIIFTTSIIILSSRLSQVVIINNHTQLFSWNLSDSTGPLVV